jgi:hypothetical protein
VLPGESTSGPSPFERFTTGTPTVAPASGPVTVSKPVTFDFRGASFGSNVTPRDIEQQVTPVVERVLAQHEADELAAIDRRATSGPARPR